MDNRLRKLIEEGEGQQLDFKYCVSDSRKIARALVAFSNADGGRLLIGVRDNGSIAGIRSEEEIFMVDTAVELYCRPGIKFTARQHVSGGKTILEVEVLRGEKRPYQAKDEDGKWIPYFRHGDQNLVASRVMLRVWSKKEMKKGVMVRFSKPESLLLDYLKENGSVTLSKFRKLARISSYRAENILANLIVFGVIKVNVSEKGFTYGPGGEDKEG